MKHGRRSSQESTVAAVASTASARQSASPIAHLTVGDVMRRGLIICPPDANLKTIARTMAEACVHCVFITDILRRNPSGEVLTWGVVSDLDVLHGLRNGAVERIASDVATTELVTVDPTDALDTAVRLMTDCGTAHLVVVSSQQGRPVGMLSSLDVARAASS
jgi:CBS domain-containing protein